mgnify:CR=1 FL=1
MAAGKYCKGFIGALAVATLTSFCPTSQAAPFYGLSIGQGLENRDVMSMRARKFTNLVRQQTDFSCGAAALATILKYGYRLDVDESVVLEGMFAVSDLELVQRQGFSLLDIKNYVNGIGMRGRGYKVPIDTLEQIRIPTIVLLDLAGYKHFVVLKKTTEDSVYLADPALGNKVIKKRTFLNSGTGSCLPLLETDSIDPHPWWIRLRHLQRAHCTMFVRR